MLLRLAMSAAVVPAVFAAAEPCLAKTRAMTMDIHCSEDPTVPAPVHRLSCPIQGPGKFDVTAEASFSKGQPGASASMALTLDDHACGQSETVKFEGRGIVYGSCERRRLEAGMHTLLVSVDAQMANYGGVHVTLIQRDAVPRVVRPKTP